MVPEDLRPFIEFKASLSKVQLKREQLIAVFQVATTSCYIPVFLNAGMTIESVKDELAGQEADMDAPSEKVVEEALKRLSSEKKK